MTHLIDLVGKNLVHALEIKARKDASFHTGLLVYPDEVNGFWGWVGWGNKNTPVEIRGFSHLCISSLDYIDAFWRVNVDLNEVEGLELNEENQPYILGISYCITDPINITYYRTWELA